MRNFIILCRLHTEQVLHAAFSGLKTSKKDPKAITAVLILAVFSVLMSALYGFLFAGMMTQSGTELFYFPTMLLLSLFFGFLFSFMGAKDVLFSGRDLDFLLSMPVSPSLVMLSAWLPSIWKTFYLSGSGCCLPMQRRSFFPSLLLPPSGLSLIHI